MTVSAKASPRAIMAVVEALGARPRGQASSIFADRHHDVRRSSRLVAGDAVIAMTGWSSFLTRLKSRRIRRFAAGGNDQNQIVEADRSDIAVQGVGGGKKMAGRSRAGEGGGEFPGDVPAFPRRWSAPSRGISR